MPTDTIVAPAPEVTEKQNRLWKDYQAAVSAHNIACASSSYTTEDRVRLALDCALAWRAFSESCGVVLPSAEAEQKMKELRGQIDRMHSAMLEVYAYLYPVEQSEMIVSRPELEEDRDRHNVGCMLIGKAFERLHVAVKAEQLI